MKKSLISALIAATAIFSISETAHACSRLVTDTQHGTLVIRTADWYSAAPFDGHVSVFPVASQRTMRGEVSSYKNAYQQWQTKYHTVSFEEHGAFNGLSGHTVNDQGLNVAALSQSDSEPFLAQHKDNGAPAVNIADVATFIAENYATVAEVKAALDNKAFQFAWADAPNGLEHAAGLHYSIVDKDGNIMLIQLGEGGVPQYELGDADSDLRVKTNDPFQNKQREFVSQFDIKDPKVAASLPWGIGGKQRNVRLLAVSEQLNTEGLNYQQTVARQRSAMDVAGTVPFEIQDPATGEDYPTFFTVQLNLDNGDIWFRSEMTRADMSFNIEDTKGFSQAMTANIQQQVDNGATELTWKAYQ
ncbi:linear amide C-N hydrolase [Agarivorans gilvus]|uniref:Choloylglycine hydrolase/NAAA C-terminal domain-containing protein n=1 Tax=Agarivorans gilvus TaxID=680279 RepID=A0ABQ1I7C0_9ALTE|nr:linear amide C-N hydrolase [Agarivorans gilvus]GGB18224.1 hypothetical protein GCM10007414_34550 [Agarivorans gilvus]